MTSFSALLISKTETGQSVEWKTLTEADLMEGDVTVRVTHSTINYKDGLAITGKAPIVRRWPMIPGVDFSGIVTVSTNPGFKPGDEVIGNACGMGELHYGGYSQMARVHGEWLQHVPAGLSRADCMAIGTAGYTAMLAVMALEAHGLTPDDGPILVSGAAGGVGSVAVALLAKLGFTVVAASGRMEIAGALRALGAAEVIDRNELTGASRPLAKERWAGAIDVAGSITLANILTHIRYGGTVAACGLVQGIDLPASVAPFILRGVTLAGIESVMTPRAKREAAWKRLAVDLDVTKLHVMTETRPLKDVLELAPLIVLGKVRGRVVFEVPELVEEAAPAPAPVEAAAEEVVEAPAEATAVAEAEAPVEATAEPDEAEAPVEATAAEEAEAPAEAPALAEAAPEEEEAEAPVEAAATVEEAPAEDEALAPGVPASATAEAFTEFKEEVAAKEEAPAEAAPAESAPLAEAPADSAEPAPAGSAAPEEAVAEPSAPDASPAETPADSAESAPAESAPLAEAPTETAETAPIEAAASEEAAAEPPAPDAAPAETPDDSPESAPADDASTEPDASPEKEIPAKKPVNLAD